MVTVNSLEQLGRTRLSPNYFLRDFLHSEIAQVEGITNVPVDPDLLIESGRNLCTQVLEPIQTALGKVSIRSAYRSPTINQIGNEKGYNCANNEYNFSRHIWDVRDADGHLGATACVVVNAFVEFYEATGDWTVLAWWLHDHIKTFREVTFYPKLAAFNINWYAGPVSEVKISAQMPNPDTGRKGILVRSTDPHYGKDHSSHYREWLNSI